MATKIDRTQLLAALQQFAAANYGPDSYVPDVQTMESGHAGLTFGFEITSRTDNRRLDRFILRLAPPGVTRKGNTDVYRQARLLKALRAGGLPVPNVPYSSPGEELFGTPYIMMEWLPGRTFFIWDPDPAFERTAAAVTPIWRECAVALADLHRFDWRRHLADWDPPRPLAEEITRWDKILDKTPDPKTLSAGRNVRDRLLATVPSGAPIGLIHGDYQPGNALYQDGRLTGIIDWELASIGEQTLDLGWLMMLADPVNWNDDWRTIAPLGPEALQAIYEQRIGVPVRNTAWYRALAGYRLGAISGMNVHLHRTGRRPDPIWEHFALAAPNLFSHAEALLTE